MRTESRARGFDVICAGEALWQVNAGDVSLATEPSPFRFEPGGGAVNAAITLARQGLRVGLATVLSDDTYGRALVAKLASSRIDVGGVELARPTSSIVFVSGGGGARQVVSF